MEFFFLSSWWKEVFVNHSKETATVHRHAYEEAVSISITVDHSTVKKHKRSKFFPLVNCRAHSTRTEIDVSGVSIAKK